MAVMPLQFEAAGNENAVGFTVNYDANLLRFYRATTTNGTTLTVNNRQPGQLGLLLGKAVGQTFAAGAQTLATLEFVPTGGDDTVTTRLRFDDQVVQRAVADSEATALSGLSFVEADFTISGRAVAQVSAASYAGVNAASDSIRSAFGMELATTTQAAFTLPLPDSLGGTRVSVKDSAGIERAARIFFVSPTQLNYLLPSGLSEGLATVTITNSAGVVARGLVIVGAVAPAVFTADASGKGLAAADVQHRRNDGSEWHERVAIYDPNNQQYVGTAIALRADEQAFLTLYGTGWRQRQNAVSARIGGLSVEVLYAGAQGQYAGLDQINLRLPANLSGRGELTVELEIDGRLTNPVTILVK